MRKNFVLLTALTFIFSLLSASPSHSETKKATTATPATSDIKTPAKNKPDKATVDTPAKTLDNAPDRKTLSKSRKTLSKNRKTLSANRKTLSSRKTRSMKKQKLTSAKPVPKVSPEEQSKFKNKINQLLDKNKLDKAVAAVKEDPLKLYAVIDSNSNTEFGVNFVTKITKDAKQTKTVAGLFFSQDMDYFSKLSASEESLIRILAETARKQPEAFQSFMIHGCKTNWFSCAVRFNGVAKAYTDGAVSSFKAIAPHLGKENSVNFLLALDDTVRHSIVAELVKTPSSASKWNFIVSDKRMKEDAAPQKNNGGIFSRLYKTFRHNCGKLVRAAFQTLLGKGPFVEKYAEHKTLRSGVVYTSIYGVRNLRIPYPVEVQIFDFDLTKYSLSPFYNKKDEKQLGKNNTVAVLSGTYWDNDLLPMGTYIYNGKLLPGTQKHLDYNLVSKLYGEAGFALWKNEKAEILNLKKIASQKANLQFGKMTAFVQGGPLIVENHNVATHWVVPGEAYNGADTYAAIGITKDNHLLFALTKTFTNEETGVTYKELAEILIKQGAQTAMCVDGGGLEGIAILNAKVKTQTPLTKNVFLLREKKPVRLAYNKM